MKDPFIPFDIFDASNDHSKSTEDTIKEETQAQWKDPDAELELTPDETTQYQKPIVVENYNDDYFSDKYHSLR